MLKYIIDGSALFGFGAKSNSAGIYKTLAESGKVKTVKHVLNQLGHHKEVLNELLPYKKQIVIDHKHPDALETLKHIANDFPEFFYRSGSIKPNAPAPWLVACARAYNCTLVTDEAKHKIKRMPYYCRQPSINVQCIEGSALLSLFGL